jgi:undecaprenyl-diphosphatase
MPSCHAANAFAIALVLGQPWALGLAFLVALARVVAGQHYPSDAVVGALVGAAVGGAARTAAEALLRRFRRARTPRRPRAGPAAAVRSE